MSRSHSLSQSFHSLALIVLAAVISLCMLATARAQFVTQQVGGVSIDANGIVQKVRLDEVGELLKVRKAAFQPVPDDLSKSGLRKVSLRQLAAAIAEHHKNGTPLTDDMLYLAGLQRIQYVFVYPEQNDIVLAGPGEGWKISTDGEIIGATTNRPVLLLDDLLVALRRPRPCVKPALPVRSTPRPKASPAFRSCSRTSAARPTTPSR